jgi:hypothetical protein
MTDKQKRSNDEARRMPHPSVTEKPIRQTDRRHDSYNKETGIVHIRKENFNTDKNAELLKQTDRRQLQRKNRHI